MLIHFVVFEIPPIKYRNILIKNIIGYQGKKAIQGARGVSDEGKKVKGTLGMLSEVQFPKGTLSVASHQPLIHPIQPILKK